MSLRVPPPLLTRSCAQIQGQAPPPPVRFTRKAASEEDAGEVEEQEEDGGGQDIMDMLPRADVRCVDAAGAAATCT